MFFARKMQLYNVGSNRANLAYKIYNFIKLLDICHLIITSAEEQDIRAYESKCVGFKKDHTRQKKRWMSKTCDIPLSVTGDHVKCTQF